METKELLDNMRVPELKALAKSAGLPKTITGKGDLVNALNRFVTNNLPQCVQSLSATERQLLAEAAYNDGRVKPSVFAAKYGVRCPSPGYFDRQKDPSLIHLLIGRDRYLAEICVAEAIIEPLRSMLPKPAPPAVKTLDALPAEYEVDRGYARDDVRPVHVFDSQRIALAELRRVLTLVQAGKLTLQDKSRRPTSGAERLISASLAAPDFAVEAPDDVRNKTTLVAGPIRAHAWAVVVQQCGWCKASGSSLKLTNSGKKLVEAFDLQEYRNGIERLGADDAFDELNRIPHIRGQAGKGKRHLSHPSERRESVLASICDWPIGQWLTVEDAFGFVFATGNGFYTTSQPVSLYFFEQQYGYLTDPEDINRQYFRALVFETLATLGLVDVAYVYPHDLWPELSGHWGTDDLDFCSRYDGLLYARLNNLGAFCLGVTEHFEPPAAPRRNLFTVLANHDLAVGGGEPLTAADRSMLERCARQHGDRVWRLEAARILDYLEAGGLLGDLRGFLTENAANNIPAPVNIFLDDLEKRTHAVVGSQASLLIEFADGPTAATVAHDSQAGKHCYLAGERFVVVPEKNERAFRTALKKLGFVL